MTRKLLLPGALLLFAGVAWLQVIPPRVRPLAEMIPSGALLSIEAKDFSQQLNDWNTSPAKAKWLMSQNYAAFAQSNLFKKMAGVFAEYGRESGFAPGLAQVLEIAGTESALALYDPRELQFLYITRLTNARLTKSQLWALRNQFETRESAGKTFYLRGTGNRMVAFAASGDYLFVATRDDLIAHALALQSGTATPRLADEQWYAKAAAASTGQGDLRMFLNLTTLVKNTYFRSYWIQRNVSDLKPFTTEICDLDRKGTEFTERRVLLRDMDAHPVLAPDASRVAMEQLIASVPDDAGLYRAWADPKPVQLAALIEQKLLSPHVEALRDRRYAPPPPDESNAGTEADLETRIDQAPLTAASGDPVNTVLRALLDPVQVKAALEIQTTDLSTGSNFLTIPSVIALTAAGDWDAARVRASISQALSGNLSTGTLGLEWIADGPSTFKLNGLTTLLTAVRGHTLYLANSAVLLTSTLARPAPAQDSGTLTYAASFRHGRERTPYLTFMRALDAASVSPAQFGYRAIGEPAFFSSDVGSLDDALSGVRSIDIAEQQLADRVLQTVHYF